MKNKLEKLRNIKKYKIHPALVFFTLTLIIMIISSIGGILKIESNYYTVNTVSGELESQIVNINNLFNRTGIHIIYAIRNFNCRSNGYRSSI